MKFIKPKNILKYSLKSFKEFNDEIVMILDNDSLNPFMSYIEQYVTSYTDFCTPLLLDNKKEITQQVYEKIQIIVRSFNIIRKIFKFHEKYSYFPQIHDIASTLSPIIDKVGNLPLKGNFIVFLNKIKTFLEEYEKNKSDFDLFNFEMYIDLIKSNFNEISILKPENDIKENDINLTNKKEVYKRWRILYNTINNYIETYKIDNLDSIIDSINVVISNAEISYRETVKERKNKVETMQNVSSNNEELDIIESNN